MAEEKDESRICRFCFSSDDAEDLISPCACTGSQAVVHARCLRKWQTTLLLESKEGAIGKRHSHCSVCSERFSLRPPSRTDLLRARVGTHLLDSLLPGTVLVATRKMSERRNIEGLPPALRSLLELKLAHWRHSLYLIYAVDSESAPGHVLALNLTRGKEEPVPPAVRAAQINPQNADLEIIHHNGGPVKWSTALHAACVLTSDAAAAEAAAAAAEYNENVESKADDIDDRLVLFPLSEGRSGLLVVGGLHRVLGLARSESESSLTLRTLLRSGPLPLRVVVKTFSGFARWGHSQMLSEIVRGSWALAPHGSDCFDVKPYPSLKQWRELLQTSFVPPVASEAMVSLLERVADLAEERTDDNEGDNEEG